MKYKLNRSTLLGIASVAATGFLLAGCTGGASSPGATPGSNDVSDLHVGFSTASMRDSLLKTWAESTCDAVVDAGGTCTISDAQADPGKQISDLQDLIAAGANFIIVNPVDAQGIVPAVENANRLDIPVITIDSTAEGGEVLTAVHVDNYAAGYEAARYCADQNAGQDVIKVAELEGQAGQANTINRHEGWQAGVEEFGLDVVFNQYTDWDTGKAEQATRDLLNSQPDIDCIWAHADGIILGATRALESSGISDVITIGMGMYGGGPEAIDAGSLTASWYMEPEKTGQAAAEAAIEYWENGTSEPDIAIEMTFVTKENVNDFPWN
ncbi:sugar ABC transporter substrate-binding protein [Gulosibacter chungangensis]|uniref:Sugar ABC transporter substrate-binding protein n=1 Tax=Gulosibacter chungangensis TaxID=979746 RepID=A0A7J5BA98_9MICO|nr:sugar ABC transporter substrate-binding protein [Gulosibacter chungangensis]KAB1642705.1 sugar ABC transporter substrate-binding protein [Gulosibacter chungangensis]